MVLFADSAALARVEQLLTMVLGPNALLVAARGERDLREAVPDVTEVFLDATPGRSKRE